MPKIYIYIYLEGLDGEIEREMMNYIHMFSERNCLIENIGGGISRLRHILDDRERGGKKLPILWSNIPGENRRRYLLNWRSFWEKKEKIGSRAKRKKKGRLLWVAL